MRGRKEVGAVFVAVRVERAETLTFAWVERIRCMRASVSAEREGSKQGRRGWAMEATLLTAKSVTTSTSYSSSVKAQSLPGKVMRMSFRRFESVKSGSTTTLTFGIARIPAARLYFTDSCRAVRLSLMPLQSSP